MWGRLHEGSASQFLAAASTVLRIAGGGPSPRHRSAAPAHDGTREEVTANV